MWNILINPSSGNNKAKKIGKKISKLMKYKQINYQVFFCEKDINVKQIAKHLSDNGETKFILVGSTISLHNFINGADLATAKVGLIPIGNSNEFANFLQNEKKTIFKNIYSTKKLRNFLNHILCSNKQKFDLMKINDTYALNYINIGADADALNLYNKKNKFSNLRYKKSIFKAIKKSKSKNINANIDGKDTNIDYIQLNILNTKTYAGNIDVNPLSNLHDDRMNLHILHSLTKHEKRKYYYKLIFGKHIYEKQLNQKWINKIDINFETPTCINVDGLLQEHTEISVQSIKDALTLYIPVKTDYQVCNFESITDGKKFDLKKDNLDKIDDNFEKTTPSEIIPENSLETNSEHPTKTDINL